MEKRFIAADDLLLDSFQLAAKINASGFRPDFLVGLWRGGSAVGIAVQEGLEHFGNPTDHIAIRTSYSGRARYAETVGKADAIRVHGLQYLLENLCGEHAMLIVDDVYSTGTSVQAVIDPARAEDAAQPASRYSRCQRVVPTHGANVAAARLLDSRNDRLVNIAVRTQRPVARRACGPQTGTCTRDGSAARAAAGRATVAEPIVKRLPLTGVSPLPEHVRRMYRVARRERH